LPASRRYGVRCFSARLHGVEKWLADPVSDYASDKSWESIASALGELSYKRLIKLEEGSTVYCWVGCDLFPARAALRIGHISGGGIIFIYRGKEYGINRRCALLAHIHESKPK
jgi:hypothetical protein